MANKHWTKVNNIFCRLGPNAIQKFQSRDWWLDVASHVKSYNQFVWYGQHLVVNNQCDQILQNFASLSKFKTSWAFFREFICYLENLWTYFGKIWMLLANLYWCKWPNSEKNLAIWSHCKQSKLAKRYVFEHCNLSTANGLLFDLKSRNTIVLFQSTKEILWNRGLVVNVLAFYSDHPRFESWWRLQFLFSNTVWK